MARAQLTGIRPNGQTQYTLEHGSYYLRDPRGNIMFMCDQVGMVVSQSDATGNFTMLKHGDVNDMAKWKDDHQGECQTLFGDLTLVSFPRGQDALFINACVDNPNKLKLI